MYFLRVSGSTSYFLLQYTNIDDRRDNRKRFHFFGSRKLQLEIIHLRRAIH